MSRNSALTTITAYYAAFNAGHVEGMLACLHDDFAHHVNEGATRLGKAAGLIGARGSYMARSTCSLIHSVRLGQWLGKQ